MDSDAFVLLIVLPLMWLIVLVLLSGITVFNLRHTKQGYRFRMHQVLLVSIIGSLTLGGILHAAHWSNALDLTLKQRVLPYRELRNRRMNMWTHPESGMLAGTVVQVRGNTVFLRDFDEVLWEVDIAGAAPFPEWLLEEAMPLRILGYSLGDALFIAESIRPWRPGGPDQPF